MIDSAANELGKAIEKCTVWVCRGPDCGDWYVDDGPGRCPTMDCNRTLVERHRWLCDGCGASYPGNRKPPEHCEECGELFRRVLKVPRRV